MNPFFAGLAAKLAASASRSGASVEVPQLDSQLAEELLALARVVAHKHERRFAPLATFMAGVATERSRQAWGADATAQRDVVRTVRELLESEDATDA